MRQYLLAVLILGGMGCAWAAPTPVACDEILKKSLETITDVEMEQCSPGLLQSVCVESQKSGEAVCPSDRADRLRLANSEVPEEHARGMRCLLNASLRTACKKAGF